MRGDMALASIIRDTDPIVAISQRDDVVTKFFCSHLPELISVAIGEPNADRSVDQLKCLQLLTTRNSVLVERLATDTESINCLVDLAGTPETTAKVAQVLLSILDSGNSSFLDYVKNPADFAGKLVDNISQTMVFEFMYALCGRTDEDIRLWARSIQLYKILYERFDYDEDTACNCMKLFGVMLTRHNFHAGILDFTANTEISRHIILTACISPTVRLAEVAFNVAITLLYSCLQQSSSPNFGYAVESLKSCVPKICNYIESGRTFTPDKAAALNLLYFCIDNLRFASQSIISCLATMTEHIFTHPLNSFLINSMCKLLLVLSNLSKEFHEFMTLSKLQERILKVKGNNRMLNGFIFRVSFIISKRIQLAELDKEFIDFLNEAVIPFWEKSEQPFGGPLPELPRDEIP